MAVRQSADEIEEQAARWILRLDRAGFSESLTREMEEWLEGDIRRRGALLQAESAWLSLDVTRGSSTGHKEADHPLDARGTSDGDHAGGVTRRRLLIGAGGLAAVGVGLSLLPRSGESYRTTRGEIRRIPLQDRSIATINTASRMDVAFSDHARRITLDDGEAWFQVVPDKARPFTVSAGAVRVQAVGTAFSVRRLNEGVEILVTEGVVRTWTIGAEDRATIARAGDRAFVSNIVRQVQVSAASAEIARALAWRDGHIDLGGETLDHAVAEFNRYNAVTLVVGDPTLRTRPLYGAFRLDDPEGFARTVAAGFRTSMHDEGSSTLVIGNIRHENDTDT
jgi:transmembrane sensor